DAVQSIFESAATESLRTSMVAAVGSAQQFHPQPPPDHANSAANEAMSMEEARSFQAAEKSLQQVLEQFNQLHFDQEYGQLEQVTTDHAQAILQSLDGAFTATRLYWPPQENFDSWTTGSLPTVAVYKQGTADKMDSYLTDEKQEVEKFSVASEIVVGYLKQHVLRKDKLPATVSKWQGISDDLTKYDPSTPSTGLQALEQFLAVDMDKTAPPNCNLPASLVNSNRLYFVQARRSLERALVSRCRFLSNQYASDEYSQFAEDFNQHLAGKFPFCAAATCDPQAEADPGDVIELFGRLDQD
ncbi:MAG: hypothetical protein ACRD3S_22370, partial [Terracidiphilus sp.]